MSNLDSVSSEVLPDVDILSQCSEYGPAEPVVLPANVPVTTNSLSLGLSSADRDLLLELVSGFRAFNAGLERGLPTFKGVLAEMNAVVARFERLHAVPPVAPDNRAPSEKWGAALYAGDVVHVQEIPSLDAGNADPNGFQLETSPPSDGHFDDLRLADDPVVPSTSLATGDDQDVRLGDIPPGRSSSATFIAKENKQTTRIDFPAEPAVADSEAAQAADPDANGLYLAGKYFQKGETYRGKGDARRALACFTEAIRLNPRSVLALIERGQLYRSAKKPDLAITDFNAALDVDPDLAEAFHRRGNALADQGRIDEALEDYTAAIQREPGAVALVNRALAHTKKQDYDKAIEDTNDAIRLNPGLGSAFFVRGASHSNRGSHDLAIRDLDAAVKLEPKNPLLYNERGLVLARMEKYTDAVVNYSKALRLAPNLHIARVNRAIAHRLRGDPDLAIAEFTDLLRRHPKAADAYYQRGLAFRDKKDFEAALADFDQTLELKPEHEEAEKAKIESDQARRRQGDLKPRAEPEGDLARRKKAPPVPETTSPTPQKPAPVPVSEPVEKTVPVAPPPVKPIYRPSAASAKKQATNTDEDERPSWQRWAPYAAGAAAILVLGSFVLNYFWTEDTGAETEYAEVLYGKPLVRLDSAELVKRFTDAPTDAESKYNKEVIELIGIVQEIKKEGEVSTVVLKDRKQSTSIDCVLSTEASGLSSLQMAEKEKGKLVSIKGVCEAAGSAVKLVGCRLGGLVRLDRRGKVIGEGGAD